MSTVYAWNDPAALTALDVSTSDKIFLGDVSAGSATNPVTKVATVYDFREVVQRTTYSTSSNLATISGSANGIVDMGTSTAIFLSAPTAAGVWKTFVNNTTSTVATTITASGCSIGLGTTIITFPSGEDLAISVASVSTLRWLTTSFIAVASTMLS